MRNFLLSRQTHLLPPPSPPNVLAPLLRSSPQPSNIGLHLADQSLQRLSPPLQHLTRVRTACHRAHHCTKREENSGCSFGTERSTSLHHILFFRLREERIRDYWSCKRDKWKSSAKNLVLELLFFFLKKKRISVNHSNLVTR